MKHLIIVASLLVLGCGGGESEDSAETADEEAEDIAGAYHDALDKAEAVEAIIEQEMEDLDAAIKDAEGDVADD